MIYHEMLKYQAERNWENNVHELRSKYNLPLSDKNVCNVTYDTWKRIVNDRIKHVAFLSLTEMCSSNKKTCLLSYSKLMGAPYLSKFKPDVALMVFRARVGVYDIKDNFKRKYDGDLNCPFCRQLHENFEHIFQCNSGIFCRRSLRRTTLFELATMEDTQKAKKIGEFLVRYQKYREIFL